MPIAIAGCMRSGISGLPIDGVVPQTGLEPVTPSLRIPDRGISPINGD
jgi:hypothetical protein